MKQSFLEYFRCPSSAVDFRTTGPALPRAGFFGFGPDLICYGTLCSGETRPNPADRLFDASAETRIERETCLFPFDPDEVITNLRYERYRRALSAPLWQRQSLVRGTYYGLRPLLPIAVRKHLQRIALKGWHNTRFPRWPVDQTVDQLMDKMMAGAIRASRLERLPFIWFWPDGLEAAAIMTHDVETAAGRDFCPKLMDIDDSFHIKSSFQIIPEERYAVPRSLLSSLRQRGFEINIHDINHDGNLFQNRDEFLRRVSRINAYGKEFGACGYRSGILYRNLDWYDAFDYSYDMSVPNAGHLDPQPGGCCTTKPYFVGKILELPVIATQDYTLYHILQRYSIDLWTQQIDSVLSQNGLLSFIIHPDYLLDSRAQQIYASLLENLAQLRHQGRLWIALPREVNEWWRSRSAMKLVQKRGEWQIEGQGSERARVAFASLNGDALEYTVEDQPALSGVKATQEPHRPPAVPARASVTPAP